MLLRMLIINSPHNPTGGVGIGEVPGLVYRLSTAGVSFNQADLDQILEWLEELQEKPILFSDETLVTGEFK